MSNKKATQRSLFNRIKIGSTKGHIVLFSILIITVSILFFSMINRYQDKKMEKLLTKTTNTVKVTKTLHQIENETQNALNYSLIYHLSKNEVDRFQTAYSLKSTQRLFDKSFTNFLAEIGFENNKNIMLDVTLTLNNPASEKLNLLAVVGEENEDGSQNILLIQK